MKGLKIFLEDSWWFVVLVEDFGGGEFASLSFFNLSENKMKFHFKQFSPPISFILPLLAFLFKFGDSKDEFVL